MGRDLALLIPEIAVLLTAVGALIAEMLRRPRAALAVAVIGLLVATGLTLRLVGGTETTVFGGSFRIDGLQCLGQSLFCCPLQPFPYRWHVWM